MAQYQCSKCLATAWLTTEQAQAVGTSYDFPCKTSCVYQDDIQNHLELAKGRKRKPEAIDLKDSSGKTGRYKRESRRSASGLSLSNRKLPEGGSSSTTAICLSSSSNSSSNRTANTAEWEAAQQLLAPKFACYSMYA